MRCSRGGKLDNKLKLCMMHWCFQPIFLPMRVETFRFASAGSSFSISIVSRNFEISLFLPLFFSMLPFPFCHIFLSLSTYFVSWVVTSHSFPLFLFRLVLTWFWIDYDTETESCRKLQRLFRTAPLRPIIWPGQRLMWEKENPWGRVSDDQIACRCCLLD